MNTKKTQRILCRTLARELSPEDLGMVGGSFASRADEPADPGDPIFSTLVATYPSFREDQ